MASTVWRGYITFGLISIPVRLFRAARAEKVSFRRLYREEPRVEAQRPRQESFSVAPLKGASYGDEPLVTPMSSPARVNRERQPEPILTPVQQVSVRKGTDEVLQQRSVVKGYEYEKDRFVVVEPEELKSAARATSTEMEIQEFVQLSEIDPVYFETSYYISPEQAGEKAYALLYRSMQQSGLVALAQFAMHNREHVVALRPGKTGLLAHTMFFSSEVRADEEYRTDTSAVSEKELELAQTLIHSLAAPFEPEKYKDMYRERVESIIAKKVQGQPITRTETPQKSAEVVDIADALRRSLANLKKPATSDQQPRERENTAPVTRKKVSRGAGQK